MLNPLSQLPKNDNEKQVDIMLQNGLTLAIIQLSHGVCIDSLCRIKYDAMTQRFEKQFDKSIVKRISHGTMDGYVVFGFSNCCIWISKFYYPPKLFTRLSHDQVTLFKTFCGTAQNCARQTINHAAYRIKQAQLQLCG